MDYVLFFYLVLLFVLLTPGILLSLPPKGSKLTVAITHGLVLAIVWCLTNKMVWSLSNRLTHPMSTVIVKV
jgi:hypothetical protein